MVALLDVPFRKIFECELQHPDRFLNLVDAACVVYENERFESNIVAQ